MKLSLLLSGVLVFFLFLFGCREEKTPDISHIKVHTNLVRFDQQFMHIDSLHIHSDLKALAGEYPAFFPVYMKRIMNFRSPSKKKKQKRKGSDSALYHFITSSDIRQLQKAINQEFTSTKIQKLHQQLNLSFKYIKYYYPSFKAPKIVTFMSALANYGAITVDTVLGIGLDMFLGKDFPLYRKVQPPYPDYLLHRFTPENIVPSSIKVIYNQINPPPQKGTLLDEMLAKGKMLYFMDKVLPQTPDSLKIGYTQKQLTWSKENEKYIWQYFVQKDLLYNSKQLTIRYYIGVSPSSKGMPPEAPGNIGSWVGWQIIKHYMKAHPETTVQELLKMKDSQKILNQSGYRPH